MKQRGTLIWEFRTEVAQLHEFAASPPLTNQSEPKRCWWRTGGGWFTICSDMRLRSSLTRNGSRRVVRGMDRHVASVVPCKDWVAAGVPRYVAICGFGRLVQGMGRGGCFAVCSDMCLRSSLTGKGSRRVHVCMYTCVRVCMCAGVHVYTCLHMCMCACACIHVSMCACMHVCMCAYM